MKVYQSHEIKNIALLGSKGSGKTTLAEAMLYECGVIKRRGTVAQRRQSESFMEMSLVAATAAVAAAIANAFPP